MHCGSNRLGRLRNFPSRVKASRAANSFMDPRGRINTGALRKLISRNVGGVEEIVGGAYLWGSIPPEEEVWDNIEAENWVVWALRKNLNGQEYLNDTSVNTFFDNLNHKIMYELDDANVTVVLVAGDAGQSRSCSNGISI